MDKRKLNIFLLLLFCSSMAWFISKLSESYTHTVTFDLEYINVPDSLLLQGFSKQKIVAKLKGNGFLFLRTNFGKNKLQIDASAPVQKGNSTRYYIPPLNYNQQIDNALQNYFTVVEVDRDTLFLKFDKIASKKVIVEPKIIISTVQNFLREGELIIKPDSIRITGPKNEIDTMTKVVTEVKNLKGLSTNFTEQLTLKKPKSLKNTIFSVETVTISGKITKFSEKIVYIPIEVTNLPEGMEIRTFPQEIPILCKARLEDLKELSPFGFKLIADYNGIKNSTSDKLFLQLIQQPNILLDATIMETEVEYILRKIQ